jgi:hypothetical protein
LDTAQACFALAIAKVIIECGCNDPDHNCRNLKKEVEVGITAQVSNTYFVQGIIRNVYAQYKACDHADHGNPLS